MADSIQADYERLDAIAQRFAAQAEQISAMRGQVEQSMSPLVYNGGWMGVAADSFQAEMEGVLLPGVQRLQEALAEANRVTRQISELVRNAEEEACSPFRGGQFVGQPVGGSGGSIGGDKPFVGQPVGDGVPLTEEPTFVGQPVGGSGGSIGGERPFVGQPVGSPGGSIGGDKPFVGQPVGEGIPLTEEPTFVGQPVGGSGGSIGGERSYTGQPVSGGNPSYPDGTSSINPPPGPTDSIGGDKTYVGQPVDNEKTTYGDNRSSYTDQR